MKKTVISLEGKYGIVLQGDRIVDFIYVPEDYRLKDFVEMLSIKVKNKYINRGSSVTICYDENGVGVALHDELQQVFDQGICYPLGVEKPRKLVSV